MTKSYYSIDIQTDTCLLYLDIEFQENIQIKLEVNPMKYNFQQIPRLTVAAAVTELELANIQLPSPCIDVVCFPGKTNAKFN